MGREQPCNSGGYTVTSFFPTPARRLNTATLTPCKNIIITWQIRITPVNNYWQGIDNYKLPYQWIVSWGQVPSVAILKNALFNYGPIVVCMVV